MSYAAHAQSVESSRSGPFFAPPAQLIPAVRKANNVPAPTSYRRGELAKAITQVLRRRFDRAATEWMLATQLHSSISAMKNHPLYAEVQSSGGPLTTQFVLERLHNGEWRIHWFPLLKDITGEDPVPAYSRGIIREMAEAWIAWGRNKGII